MKKGLVLIGAALIASVSMGDVLMEVDFSGSPGGISTIASTDSQVTTHANVTYTGADALSAIGGGASVGPWAIDATGTAAVNNDLHTASTFGAPTRLDLFLGNAASGYSYDITSVDIVVRAAANGSKNWDFMYRDTGGTTHIIAGTAIAAQTGANPLTTYSIDLTSEGLAGTDSSVNWNTSGTGRLRLGFWESNGTNADNLQLDAIRINGTVIPEPATIGLMGLIGVSVVFTRRLMM